jgi:hypothetical protein
MLTETRVGQGNPRGLSKGSRQGTGGKTLQHNCRQSGLGKEREGADFRGVRTTGRRDHRGDRWGKSLLINQQDSNPGDIGPWSLVLGPWSLVLGPWSLVLGLWSLVLGPWSLVLGLMSLVLGPWSLVLGLWSLVFGLWSLVFGPWSYDK